MSPRQTLAAAIKLARAVGKLDGAQGSVSSVNDARFLVSQVVEEMVASVDKHLSRPHRRGSK